MRRTESMREVRERIRAQVGIACRCRWVDFPRPRLCAEGRCRVHGYIEAQYDGDVSIPRLALQLRLF